VRRTFLLLGLIALLSLGVMAFGLVTSGAWFSDSAASSGAILISGSLDLHVTGGPLHAKNLEPSEKYSHLGLICARNQGSTPLKYRGQFESPDPLTNDLLKYLTLKLEQHTTGHWVTLQEILGNPSVETEGLTYYFKFPGQDPSQLHHPIIQGNLAPKEKICYRMSVRLDKATPDEQQGQSIKFFLHIDATQPDNPGWQ
jgi:hypothetical protein